MASTRKSFPVSLCHKWLYLLSPGQRARATRMEQGIRLRAHVLARTIITERTNTAEWAWFQILSPSLGLGADRGSLTSFHIPDGEVSALEGMVDTGDGLQPSGECGPFLGQWT